MANPPGWYFDPSGDRNIQRYWDGHKWTDRVEPLRKRSPSINWREQVEGQKSNRTMIFVGAAIVVVLVLILAVLLYAKPWESEDYKRCVHQQQRSAGPYRNSEIDRQIKQYCQQNYG